MISTASPAPARPSGRGLELLILAVLAGVLAMHGLAAAPDPHPAHERPGVVTAHGMAHGAHSHDAGCLCCGGGEGHAGHAGATCAADGTSGTPAPPALSPSLAEPAAADAALPGWPAVPRATGRAPPDLAKLQLLRI